MISSIILRSFKTRNPIFSEIMTRLSQPIRPSLKNYHLSFAKTPMKIGHGNLKILTLSSHVSQNLKRTIILVNLLCHLQERRKKYLKTVCKLYHIPSHSRALFFSDFRRFFIWDINSRIYMHFKLY